MNTIIEYLDIMGIIAAAIAIPITFWRKMIVPINKMFASHEKLINTVQQIKSEIVTNGGKSIKDTVNGLKKTCENIEKRQRVIDQRTRASLHYLDAGLFETDKTLCLFTIFSQVFLSPLTVSFID